MGGDRVLGWHIRIPGLAGHDLHNWAVNLVAAQLVPVGFNVTSGVPVVCVSVGAVLGTMAIWLLRKRAEVLAVLFQEEDLPQTFFCIGLISLIGGNLLDAVWEVGLPYVRGQWVLEEALELLGSVAFLFATLVRLSSLRFTAGTWEREQWLNSHRGQT
ncbi:MAG: hypothetical protein NZ578_07990 [Candidatus Binatia bacterium]|nr:hypothetical protein [Candidatus Binatia bacterium]